MGTAEARKIIHSAIDAMTPEKLDAVLTFLDDLQRSSEDETVMLLSDPDFVKDYQEGKEDIRTGKTVAFNAIRRDV